MGHFPASHAHFTVNLSQLHNGWLFNVLQRSLGRHNLRLSIAPKAGKFWPVHDNLSPFHREGAKGSDANFVRERVEKGGHQAPDNGAAGPQSKSLGATV